MAELIENQNAYNRLTSDDIDALRFNLFPQRVATDASVSSLDKLVIAPGALIDLQTDPTMMDGKQASMEMLEPKFGYDDRIEHTLCRIKSDMYELLSVPDLSTEQLKGTLSSGQSHPRHVLGAVMPVRGEMDGMGSGSALDGLRCVSPG